MKYPSKTEYEISILDNQWEIAKVCFLQPSAKESLEISEKLSNKKEIEVRFLSFLDKNLVYTYPKSKIRVNKARHRRYVRLHIENIAEKLIKSVLEKLTYKKDSIFKWISYPSRKWEKKWDSRPLTFVEWLVHLCNWDASRVNELLENNTLEQIYVLMDAKTLINNESIDEYKKVNLLALKDKKDVQKDAKSVQDIVAMRKLQQLRKQQKK